MIDHADNGSEERPPWEQIASRAELIPRTIWYAKPSALTFVNERGSDYLGRPRSSAPASASTPPQAGILISFLHPADQEETSTVWSTCLHTGGGQMSFRVRSAEGEYCWFLSAGTGSSQRWNLLY